MATVDPKRPFAEGRYRPEAGSQCLQKRGRFTMIQIKYHTLFYSAPVLPSMTEQPHQVR